VLRTIWRGGYGFYIDLSCTLDNILALSATAVYCSLKEFGSGTFSKIDFTYAAFSGMYKKLMKLIQQIRSAPALLGRWKKLQELIVERGSSYK